MQRAQQGEDFAALAEEFSDDPGSKRQGGDLGLVARGQMVKPFEDAVFDMQQGDIRGLIESRFGFHVIKLTELNAGEQQSLDEVRDQVVEEARKLQAENLFAELGESFQNLVFEDPENLTTTADELGLPIMTSEWFTENTGEGVAADPQVRRAAFSEDVMNEGLVSQAVEIGFDKLIAVQKNEYEASHSMDLEEVKEEIADTIRAQKAVEKAREQGESLLESLSSSVTETGWQQFISDQQLEALTLSNQRASVPPHLQELGTAVFSHAAPKADQIAVDGLALANGDYAIFALKSVEMGNPEALDEAQKSRLQQQLLSREGAGALQQFNSFLREGAEITIAQDQL